MVSFACALWGLSLVVFAQRYTSLGADNVGGGECILVLVGEAGVVASY
jgi:hypothetical protein